MDMNTATISRVFVDEVLESGLRACVDVPDVLQHLGLDDRALDHLTPSAFGALWLELSARIGDEFFGLGKRPMANGSFTLMGHAVHGAADFRTALKRALRFMRLVIEEPHGTLEVTGRWCTVKLHEQDGPRSAFAYRTFFLILHGLNCWLVGQPIPLKTVQFPCIAPSGLSDYDRFFGTPVSFGTPRASITFEAKYLDYPVRRSEADLREFLRATPARLLMGYRPVESVGYQVRELCQKHPVDAWPTTFEIAQSLGLSVATLHRRLRNEQNSVRAIKNTMRKEHAARMLISTNLRVSQIAEQLGYSEPSAFHRAFKAWFDTTVNRHARLTPVLG